MRHRRRRIATAGCLIAPIALWIASNSIRIDAAAADIVLYSSDVSFLAGAWSRASSTTGAGGLKMTTPDQGWASANTALASPTHYFEAIFNAEAATTYQVWLRLRAAADSKWNESVWVQFSDAVDANGNPLWRIGTPSALLVNLEDCVGCGVSGWGWQDNASWTGQTARVRFPVSGTHTIRVQLREDGVDIDQIVLSPSRWLTSAPGALRNDTTIVAKSSGPPVITMVRQPYLQQVTSTSAVVVWATREGGAGEVRYQSTAGVTGSVGAATRLVPATLTRMAFNYYQHEAQLTGLASATSYAYQLAVGGIEVGPVETLATAPAPGFGTVRFIAFGDSGFNSSAQRQLASLMANDTFDFGLHTGDMVYAVDAPPSGSYQQQHNWFFDIYKNWLRSRPIFPSIGNHDDESNFAAPYRDLFVLPRNGASPLYPDHAERYYSFDYGPAHIVVLDTERAFQDPVRRNEQLAWLADDLTRTTLPWKIAVFHRPPFNAGTHHGSDVLVQTEFVPIFESFGVSLVLSGHEHDYERTIPWRQTSGGQPVTYIVTGGGGAPLYPAGVQPWTAVSRSVHHYVRGAISNCAISIEAVGLDAAVFDRVNLNRCTPSGNTPYAGVPAVVPGIVEAENFDEGGQNVAYSDGSAGNAGGVYRATDVDIQATTDAGGGYNVGWMAPGEWLKYSINVSSSGIYTIAARVAAGGPGGTFHIEADGVPVTGPLLVPNTGGWQNWQWVTVSGVTLAAGQRTLRLMVDGTGATGIFGNINSFRFTSAALPPSGTPFGGVPAAIPGIVQAENFDEGGSGVAYLDSSTGNAGGAYRSTNVDLEATADTGGGYNVGWMSAGEWLGYSVNVTSPGIYAIDARVAANGPGGTLRIEVNGVPVTGPLIVPNTGGWQIWQLVSAPNVTLAAGLQNIRVVVDGAGPSGVVGNLNFLRFTRTSQ